MHVIHDTLSSPKDDYNNIKRKLKNYFKPKINLNFEVYNLHQMKQVEEKPIAQFTTTLKQKAQQCNFVDNNREIKNQIVFN